MGTGFVQEMLERGETVTVWNRTVARTAPLAEQGARVAADPAGAVRGAERVHLSLLDDGSVEEVLVRALPALEPGTVIVDHTTTAPDPTAARARRLAAQGVAYLHAPVFMGPANARNATGLMLVAGPQTLLERVRPALERMTGTVRYMGDRPDAAAAYKLFGNMMIMFILSGVADVLALARSVGVEAADAVSLFDDFNPAGQIAMRGRRIAAGDFTPMFELSVARKDVRLMLETAAAHGETLAVLPAIAARFDNVLAAGHGNEDVSVIARADV